MLLIIGIGALAIFGYQNTYSAKGLYGSILFLTLIFGMGRFVYADLANGILIQFADKYAGDKPVETVLRGYVDEQPAINGQTTQFDFKAREIIFPDKIFPVNEITKVTIRGAVFYEIGDTLEVRGQISEPKNFEEGFDYAQYLKRSGINTVISFPVISEIKELNTGIITGLAIGFKRSVANIKNHFEETVGKSIVEPNASYINGILLGSRQNIPDDLREVFNKTGTAHILAISGYNIMIISWGVLMGLIFFFKRRVAFWISVIVIILFVILTGASASIVRAAIMGLLFSFAHGYGRLYDQRNSIVLAGGIMILHNPFTLVFDVGFQLSFAAVLGLIYLYPLINQKLNKFPEFGGLKEILSMTLSAQIAVAPLLIYYFGNFSLLSLPTNILILPFVPVAMLLGFLAGLGGTIFLPLGQIIGYAAWAITTYQIEVVKIFSELLR